MRTALAVRSDFSIGQSLLGAGAIPQLAKDLGYDVVVLTDTMTVSAMIQLSKAAKSADIKTIIGCRLRIVDEPLDKTAPKKRDKPQNEFYLKVYVKNDAGMKALYRLLSLANTEEYFYKVPRLGLEDVLKELRGGDLLVSSGDFASVLHHPDASGHMLALKSAAGAAQTFLELVPIRTPLFDTLNILAIKMARELDIPTIITRPALYQYDADADSLNVMGMITANHKLTDPWKLVQHAKDLRLGSPADMLSWAKSSRESIERREGAGWCAKEWSAAYARSETFADLCEYEWRKQDVSLPVMAADESRELMLAIRDGWQERLMRPVMGYQPEASQLSEYKQRLSHELTTLRNMGFERYFLLVRDLTDWSKRNDIMVGPGRGSVGGSLVAYLLGITDVDPIRFNLIFERFINPERLDLPDADLDFMSSRRHEVVHYLVERYGAENVAGISNYTSIVSAGAIRDVARVYELPPTSYAISKLVPKVHGKPHTLEEAAEAVAEIDAFSQEFPEPWNHSVRLQGVQRSLGRHAAGVVVAGEPILNRAVVERRRGEATVNWDKRVVEEQGLIKMDILGLSTLDVLKIAVDKIKQRHGVDIDFMSLHLDDSEVLDAFGRGDTVGIFQFESDGMQRLLKDLASVEQLTFDDIAAATALYRPGPMDSGLMDQFVSIKKGNDYTSYDHPNMEDALRPTYGVMVYQEQVMQLAQDLAGMTMAGADHLRKAMGKKSKEAMAEQRQKWVDGCLAHSGMPDTQSGALFDKIEKFAGYAFNRSHAVEYSIISYFAMWLKVHYTAEFFAASMSILPEDKLPELVKDAGVREIEILPPDINVSTNTFEVGIAQSGRVALYIALNRIKGLSDSTGNAILVGREKAGGKFDNFLDFFTNVNKSRVNKRVQETLDRVGAFANLEFRIEERARAKEYPHIKLEQIQARHPDRLRDQKVLMPGMIQEVLKSDRVIVRDKYIDARLAEISGEVMRCEGCSLNGKPHCTPRTGAKPKMVIITDHPNFTEEKGGELLSGKGSVPLKLAMKEAGFSPKDAYFTTLVKAKKDDKFLTNDQINACSVFLNRELEILHAPIIVALGSTTARFMVPGMRGSINDQNAEVHFDQDRDANIVTGISPMQVYMDPDRGEDLVKVFQRVAEII